MNSMLLPTGIDTEYRALLVEDDPKLASMIAQYLAPHGFSVSIEQRGDRAIDQIHRTNPDVVILDITLPGMDGLSICREVRSSYAGTIFILTARGDEVDEVVGLEVGADDYMSKPVRPRTLLARLRAHLRKPALSDSSHEQQRIKIGQLVINATCRTVVLSNSAIEMTTAEFDLLWLLAENVGQVLDRNEIFQKIHGIKHDCFDRSIDVRISRLRKKLGDDPNHPQRIKSVRGVGYILTPEQ